MVTIAALNVVGASGATAASVRALWRMDETKGITMRDSSGNGLDGKLRNVTMGQPGSDARVGNHSYGFLTQRAIVTVASSPKLNPLRARFTVSLRVMITQKPSASVEDYDLLRKGMAGTTGGNYKVEVLRSGFLFCRFAGSDGAVTFRHSPDLSDSVWHTVSCTRTSTGVVLTVDGASWFKAGKTGSISNTNPLLIGAQAKTGIDQYAGLMDRVMLSTGAPSP
jgi:hypothetical protein